jgi:hypothetical protein
MYFSEREMDAMENMLCIFIDSSATQKRRKTILLCIAGVASPGNMLCAPERYMDASNALFCNFQYILFPIVFESKILS